jgi:SnoaL-like domain
MLPLASLSDMLNGSEDRVEAPMSLTTMKEDAERVYRDWDDALGRKDVEAAIALYAPDCVLESPLVSHLLNAERGVVEGREKLREFVRLVFARTPPARKRHREGFFTDGRRLIWEYPRATPIGDQMDFVESMELNDEGLISRHRVYWGWFGVAVLQRDEYRR